MQAHLGFCFAKIVFLPLQIYQMKTCKTFSLLLPSHNCIIIHNVQFSRYIVSFKKLNEASSFLGTSVNSLTSFWIWWRLAGSNRWPPACKAGALPAELNPHILFKKWWAKMDSNHRPHDYQSCALASWAIGPYQLHICLGTSIAVPSKLNNALSFKTLFWP